MASFFATVTFDLKDANSADYESVAKSLAGVGLYKTVKADSGSCVELPYNTFTGSFTGEAVTKVRDLVCDHAKSVLSRCRLKGRLFVAVGGDWTWGATTV